MYPCTEEVSQVLTVCHGAAVVILGNKAKEECYGLRYKQGVKSQKPYSKDVAQCLSAGCHDASVVLIRRKS